ADRPARGYKGISGLRSTRGAQDEYNFYWLDSPGRDTTAVVAQDLASGTMRVLAEDPRADFTELLLDPISERPVAAARSFERVAWQVLDPDCVRHGARRMNTTFIGSTAGAATPPPLSRKTSL